jgi:hypothetical protein
MLKIFIISLLITGLSGCAATPYKKADLSNYAGRVGYLEKEIRPKVYILEYSHIGGYDYNLETNKAYWKRRADELCPAGFEGGYEFIHPAEAKIDEFICPQRFCTKYPLVSGVIQCK